MLEEKQEKDRRSLVLENNNSRQQTRWLLSCWEQAKRNLAACHSSEELASPQVSTKTLLGSVAWRNALESCMLFYVPASAPLQRGSHESQQLSFVEGSARRPRAAREPKAAAGAPKEGRGVRGTKDKVYACVDALSSRARVRACE